MISVSFRVTVCLVSHLPTSRDFVTTFRTKESTYSKVEHIIVTALTQGVHRIIVCLLSLSLSPASPGHPQPTLGGRFHTVPK